MITIPIAGRALDPASRGFGSGGSAHQAGSGAGPLLSDGYSARELLLLREHALGESDRVARDNPDAVTIAAGRGRRILALKRSRLFQLLDENAIGREAHGLERSLGALRLFFFWTESTVESERTFWLGEGGNLAADVVLFLARAEGVRVRRHLALPGDLVDEYVLRQALARLGSVDASAVQRIACALFDRRGETKNVLDRALKAFVRHRSGEVCAAGTEADALVDCFAVTASPPSRTGATILWTRAASVAVLLAVAAAAVAYAGDDAVAGLRRVDPRLWAALAACLATLALGVAVENRVAVLLAMLVGMPIEWSAWPMGEDRDVCKRKAEWLARFLLDKPRGLNTPGGHLACGTIAVKRALKRLCLRRERDDDALEALRQRRAEVLVECDSMHEQVAQAVAVAPGRAGEPCRLEAARRREIDEIDERVLRARLRIQGRIVDVFLEEWDALRERSKLPRLLHATAAAQFHQPADAPHGLLPDGLVRGPLAVFFESAMFLGRLVFAVFFIGTIQASHWVWALLLLLLQLYVIEPVVLKIQVASLGFVLDAPGHKLLDLRRYLEESVPADGTLVVPITVPKFSTNPLVATLKAIVTTASERSGVRVARIVPFSMTSGTGRDTVVELKDGSARQALRLRDALERELKRGRARLPIESAVTVQGRRVIVTLLGRDEALWQIIGEDANQAFVYLWRSLNALRDTLAHLGPKFRPVFILASNTKDPDVVAYEVDNLRRLQASSDAQHGGQVGYLYLLHGGEWLDFNARRRSFDASDPNLLKAMPSIERRLVDPALPGRAYFARALAGADDAEGVARAFNAILADDTFYRVFDGYDFESLPPHLRPSPATLEALERCRAGKLLGRARVDLNRELLLTAVPLRVTGDFFKKVGNDIPVQELLVTGRTRPSIYVQRERSEHVQDPAVPNYRRVWGDFARYTGLRGTTADIQAKILRGEDIEVASVPPVGAVIDDKNDFGAGEIEKAVAMMLHPANAHVVMGVPNIQVTLPELAGRTVSSDFILASKSAREMHNASEARVRARVFGASSPAFGKWWKRPQAYFAHYKEEVLNPAHALSHDFQQSYLVAGAGGCLSGFAEALAGPTHFRVRSLPGRVAARRPLTKALVWGFVVAAAALLLTAATALLPI